MTRWWKILFVFLVCLYLVPIWVFYYFPSQDGPSHIVNAQIIKDYHSSRYEFPKYYRLNIKLFPNWVSHLFLAAWQYILPPIVAEKLLLTAYVLLMPLTFWYLLRAAGHRVPVYLLFVFPFIYHYSFFMGFYNFSMGVPIALLALGYWWRHKERWSIRAVITLNAILIALYFCHLVPSMLTYALIVALALVFFKTRWRQLLVALSTTLPAALLGVQYLLTSGFLSAERVTNRLSDFPRYLRELLWLNGLVSFDLTAEKHLGQMVVIAIGICILLSFIVRVRKRIRDGHPLWDGRDYFLLPFIISLTLYLFLPDGVQEHGGIVKLRMNYITGLMIIPWLRDDLYRWARICLIGVGLAIIVVNWGYFAHKIWEMQPDLREYTAGVEMMGKNNVVMPLIFDKTGQHSQRVQIFTHAMNYYCMNNGNINLGNYEAEQHYFPVNFRSDFARPTVAQVHYSPEQIDFASCAKYVKHIVAFGENPAVLKMVEAHYDLVKHEGRLRIYESRH